MKNWHEIINHDVFRYIDHTDIKTINGEPYTAITSFAIDDALALAVSNRQSPPVMRLWVHPETLVLGIPDARLPYVEEGVQDLAKKGYHVIVRNSGGLAVPLDRGVLNLSLVVPDIQHLSIHDCYEAMVRFVQYMLRDLTEEIEAFEVVGSYCPGDYDLSIRGKKFAGISQRRVKDGAAVQIYLDVFGDSKRRASFVRDFYTLSKKNEETKFEYPDVNPEVVASLSELLGVQLTMEEMKARVRQTLEDFSTKVISSGMYEEERKPFEKRLLQMHKRNQKVAAIQE
jgi:octanoyl-[GcvH]:protein N-octanoyltransferase/lipoyl amidotransferase